MGGVGSCVINSAGDKKWMLTHRTNRLTDFFLTSCGREEGIGFPMDRQRTHFNDEPKTERKSEEIDFVKQTCFCRWR